MRTILSLLWEADGMMTQEVLVNLVRGWEEKGRCSAFLVDNMDRGYTS